MSSGTHSLLRNVETIRATPYDVFSHLVPRLMPFIKTVIIYFVAWLPTTQPTVASAILKCLPIGMLLPFVAMQGLSMRSEHTYQRRVFVGLILSAIGDACLVWPDPHFITGMIAFGIAHIWYIRAFMHQSKLRPFKAIPFLLFTILGAVILYPGLTGILIPAVPVYIFLVNAMGWRAFSRVDILSGDWTWTKVFACIGAVLFILSDFIIGIDKFLIPFNGARAIIMSSYYGGQAFIAMSSVNTNDIAVKLRDRKRKLAQEVGEIKPHED